MSRDCLKKRWRVGATMNCGVRVLQQLQVARLYYVTDILRHVHQVFKHLGGQSHIQTQFLSKQCTLKRCADFAGTTKYLWQLTMTSRHR